VKEVLQSLVDDGLVQADKIGSSNCASFDTEDMRIYSPVPSFLEFPVSERSHGNRKLVYEVATFCLPLLFSAQLQNRLNDVQDSFSVNQAQLESIRALIIAEKAARPESVCCICLLLHYAGFVLTTHKDERTAKLAQLSALKREVTDLDTELKAYGACDPAKLEETRQASVLAKEAALRWTGDIF
jgi:hypothetical protein